MESLLLQLVMKLYSLATELLLAVNRFFTELIGYELPLSAAVHTRNEMARASSPCSSHKLSSGPAAPATLGHLATLASPSILTVPEQQQ